MVLCKCKLSSKRNVFERDTLGSDFQTHREGKKKLTKVLLFIQLVLNASLLSQCFENSIPPSGDQGDVKGSAGSLLSSKGKPPAETKEFRYFLSIVQHSSQSNVFSPSLIHLKLRSNWSTITVSPLDPQMGEFWQLYLSTQPTSKHLSHARNVPFLLPARQSLNCSITLELLQAVVEFHVCKKHTS